MVRIVLLLLAAAQAFRHSASTLTPPSDGAACAKEVDELKAQNVAQAKELAELKELLKAEVGEEVAGNVTMAAAANPDAFPRCGRNYVLIAHGKECSSGDTLLGTVALADCATRCEATEGCRYFVHGKQGTSAANKCYYEHTVDACHTDTRGSATNFETDDKYDFYMLVANAANADALIWLATSASCRPGQSCRTPCPECPVCPDSRPTTPTTCTPPTTCTCAEAQAAVRELSTALCHAHQAEWFGCHFSWSAEVHPGHSAPGPCPTD